MSISVREGLPGSGKTLSALGEDILPALAARRRVVTNIDLDLDKISLLLGFDVSPYVKTYLELVEEQDDKGKPTLVYFFSRGNHWVEAADWREGGDEGKGPLIVVDECHEVLRVPGFATKCDEGVVNWLARHRHKGSDVVLITQAFGSIPAQVRERVEIRFRYLKLSFLSLGGWHAKKTHLGQDKQAVRTEIGRYNKKWFGLYRSVDDKVLESLPKQRNILLTPRIVIGVVLIIVCFWWVNQRGLYFVNKSLPSPGAVTQDLAQASGAVEPAEEPQSPDAPRAQPSLPGLPTTYQPSQTLLDLQDKIAVRQAEYQLELLEYQRPAHDEFDQSSVLITGYMFAGGSSTYFLQVDDGKGTRVVKGDDLARQYGFSLIALDRCSAILRGERGVYRLNCDVPAQVGKPADPFRAGRQAVIPARPGPSVEVGPEGWRAE